MDGPPKIAALAVRRRAQNGGRAGICINDVPFQMLRDVAATPQL
jgi:hypothetical protein